MKHVIKTALISLALGFLVQLAQGWLGSTFLTKFLHDNLITLLVALLAINSATMGIVLTKIRDLVEPKGHGDCFSRTRGEMIMSVREQICLIIVGVIALIVGDSSLPATVSNLPLFIQSVVVAVFSYSLMVLYDTAKSILIIVDYDPDKKD